MIVGYIARDCYERNAGGKVGKRTSVEGADCVGKFYVDLLATIQALFLSSGFVFVTPSSHGGGLVNLCKKKKK